MPLGDFTAKQEILWYFWFCTVKGKGLNTLFPLVKNKTKKPDTAYTKPKTETLSCQYFSDLFFLFLQSLGASVMSQQQPTGV